MSSCIPFIRAKRKHNKEIYIALLGLDNAGKTTVARAIKGISIHPVAPTVGFDRIEFAIHKYNITLYDLGGGRTIRDIWKNYFSELHGLIYVVDSTAAERLLECKTVLHKLLAHPSISGKPILLLANKKDAFDALDESELIEALQLDDLVNAYRCPCRLERCSALPQPRRGLDRAIRLGLQWLLAYIESDLTNLDARINADTTMRVKEQASESEARQERIRLAHQKDGRLDVVEENTVQESDAGLTCIATEWVERLTEKYILTEKNFQCDNLQSGGKIDLADPQKMIYEASRRPSAASVPLALVAFACDETKTAEEFHRPHSGDTWRTTQMHSSVDVKTSRKLTIRKSADALKIEELEGSDESVQLSCAELPSHRETNFHSKDVSKVQKLNEFQSETCVKLKHQPNADITSDTHEINGLTDAFPYEQIFASTERVSGPLPFVVDPLYGRNQMQISDNSTANRKVTKPTQPTSSLREAEKCSKRPSPLSRIFTPGINKLHPADQDS